MSLVLGAGVSTGSAAVATLTEWNQATDQAVAGGVSLPVDGGWTADASWESLRVRTRS